MAANKGYIVNFFIPHARNGHISTSGLKYDVTIVFLNPDFRFADSHTFKADIGLLNICMGFQDLLVLKTHANIKAQNGGFVGQNRGRGGAILTP